MATIYLNKNSFYNNLNIYKNICGIEKLSIALKDNAYGHGIKHIAKLLKKYGIQHVFVKNLFEAKLIKEYGFKSVLVLYDIPKKIQPYNFAVNSLECLRKFPEFSSIELKIDTGMHRNGLMEDEIDEALKIIKKRKLNLQGMFSHFCCADEDNDFIDIQKARLDKVTKKIKKIFPDIRIHIANSEGVLKTDSTDYDLVRIGIGAYGYNDNLDLSKKLKPVMSLYADKLSTRILQVGDSIGYGSKSYVVNKKNMVVSNYDIGYGDGFLRLNERKRTKIVDGREILGRVSMDSFSIEGDDKKVCVFNNVTDLTKTHDTITYEILSHLNPFIKRKII